MSFTLSNRSPSTAQGINSFRHNFLNSSTMLTLKPIPASVMAPITAGPIVIGETPPGDPSAFDINKLGPDGSRNPDYKSPPRPETPDDSTRDAADLRGMLYHCYTYKNQWDRAC
ncbi:hypothetical protein J3458_004482 [Metarhizium acridum]|uniref:uncharacterized protein n=1 Tax=Metarhizium acridum TaxID=92637 RepID=UPI001C6BC6E2|nr:hypothetical protein J3458_004482 [Metarhizium acridum]